jgi:hypothetical protein
MERFRFCAEDVGAAMPFGDSEAAAGMAVGDIRGSMRWGC